METEIPKSIVQIPTTIMGSILKITLGIYGHPFQPKRLGKKAPSRELLYGFLSSKLQGSPQWSYSKLRAFPSPNTLSPRHVAMSDQLLCKGFYREKRKDPPRPRHVPRFSRCWLVTFRAPSFSAASPSLAEVGSEIAWVVVMAPDEAEVTNVAWYVRREGHNNNGVRWADAFC